MAVVEVGSRSRCALEEAAVVDPCDRQVQPVYCAREVAVEHQPTAAEEEAGVRSWMAVVEGGADWPLKPHST